MKANGMTDANAARERYNKIVRELNSALTGEQPLALPAPTSIETPSDFVLEEVIV
jgi:hypothetical protein